LKQASWLNNRDCCNSPPNLSKNAKQSPTLKQARANLVNGLVASGVDSHEARLEADMIIEHVTKFGTAQQVVNDNLRLGPELMAQIDRILRRRQEREPLQYCLGSAWFMNLNLDVEPGVFIPRADTEVVVETALHLLEQFEREKKGPVHIGEIGIGSGAISIALLKLKPDLCITACDISKRAIAVAQANALKHSVADRLHLIGGDWREVLPTGFDALVSNPPYIPRAKKGNLAPEIIDYEPEEALFGEGEDGLGFIRNLASLAERHISFENGFLLSEIGDGQKEEILKMFNGANWRQITIHHDLNKLPRAVSAFVP
jgi:release factor glutamine methyltransferase